MAQDLLIAILIVYQVGLLSYAIRDVATRRKLPKTERPRNGTTYAIAMFGLFVLLKYGLPYAARLDYKKDTIRATHILTEAYSIMSHMDGLAECKRLVDAGEANHGSAYLKCQEPLIMDAYKQAGIRRGNSLQSISSLMLATAIKVDRGEPISEDEVGDQLLDILRRDQSEP